MAIMPTNIGSGRVVGRFIFGVVDGEDANEEPDLIPAKGTITFAPSIPYAPNATDVGGPVTIVPATVTAVLDADGYVCTPDPEDPTKAGYRGVRLFATDDTDLSVQNWTWTVTYKLAAIPGASAAIPAHSMTLPEGETVDLTTVVKAPASQGYGIPQAEAAALRAEAAAVTAGASVEVANEAKGLAESVVLRADSGEFTGADGQDGSNVLPTGEAIKTAISPGGAASDTLTIAITKNAPAAFSPAASGLSGSRVPETLALGTTLIDVTGGAKHNAFPGLAVCKDGSYLIVWREAISHEPSTVGVIRARKYTPNGTPLDTTYTVLTDPLDLRDPMLTVLRDGRLVMQYFKHNGTGTTIAGIFVAVSEDNGATFSERSKVPFTWGSLAACAGKVAVTPDGEWLVAAYGRTSATYQHIRLMRSKDDGLTWTNEVTVAEGQSESRNYDEPVIGYKPDGKLMCLIRVSDSNGANPSIYSTTSTDHGVTWATESRILSYAGGRPSWISLASGGILLVFRAAGAAGNATRYTLSWDNGSTWLTPVQLGRTPTSQGTYAQPIEVAPGLIAVAYALEDVVASSSTLYWQYLADGYGISPAGDNFTEAALSPYPEGVKLVDTFQRADSTTLGIADSGQKWTRVSGVIGIASSRATQNAGAGTSIEIIDSGLFDATLQVAWRWAGTGSGTGTIFRWIDSANYMFAAIESAGGNLKLYAYKDGALTHLETTSGIGLSGDTWHATEIRYWRDKITILVGGGLMLAHTLTQANQLKFGRATIVGLRFTLDGCKAGNLVVQRSTLTLPNLT